MVTNKKKVFVIPYKSGNSHVSTYLTGENDLFLPLDFLFTSGVLGLLCACAVNAFGFSDVSILK